MLANKFIFFTNEFYYELIKKNDIGRARKKGKKLFKN
jgi:hypothetical protein